VEIRRVADPTLGLARARHRRHTVVVASSLGALLDEARRRCFVGRGIELASFDAALLGEAPHRVLFVHGPGGMGKSTLLDQCRVRAEAAGRAVVELDAREQDVDLESVKEMLAGMGDQDGLVLLIDGYEALDPLDGWVRSSFLPSLPGDAVAVLAGRDPPGASWRSDPGWRVLLAVHRLAELDETEAADLLGRAGVPIASHARLIALGGGHPLALAMLADAALGDGVPDDLEQAPDVVAALLPLIAGDAPDPDHALGLELCAHAWLLTEELLTEAVGDRCAEVWGWLGQRPFIVRSPQGLYPHDLCRQVLEAELRNRSSDGQRRIQAYVHRFAREQMRHPQASDQLRAATQLLWLHRNSPLTDAFWGLRDREALNVVPGRATDLPGITRILEMWEHPGEVALAEAWIATQPESLRVIRRDGEILAFAFEAILPAAPTLEADDRVTAEVLAETERVAPLRPGERLSIGRFHGGASDYQRDLRGMAAGSVTSATNWLTRPLAWSWVVCTDAEFWDPVFDYLGFDHRLEIEVDGRHRIAYGFDWRRAGVLTWLAVMTERELTGEVGPLPGHLLRPHPLDRAAFDQGVREALRSLNRPGDLARSPLAGTELAAGTSGSVAERLRASIEQAMALMAADPERARFERVLDRTFVNASPSQEAAAEVLGLPFSTYRRHLARATEQLADVLWAVEIGELRLDDPPT
jgi:hypothetical protein